MPRLTLRSLCCAGLTGILLVSVPASAQVQPAASVPSPLKVVATVNNVFGGDLYRHLQAGGGNVFFSPYSISSALTMTYQGAKGATAEEMAKVLHLPAESQTLNDGYASLNQALHGTVKDKGFELSLANALWGQTGEPFLPAFTENLKNNYGAGLEELDFKTAPEPARLKINAWVESQTHDRIKGLLSAGSISPITRLVLTNAIYFKGQWDRKFDPKLTKEGAFRTRGAGAAVQAPLMLRQGRYRYAEDEHCQALELPYAGGELAMVVLLPKPQPVGADKPEPENSDPLEAGRKILDKAFTGDYLAGLMTKMAQREAIVTLPKWKLTQACELSDTLKKMGMKRPFAPQADFSGMTGQSGWFLSLVLHKAFVEVNEEGTEAAAATAGMMPTAALPQPKTEPVEFKADHVFLYVIVHKPSGAILFAGRVADPTKNE